MSRQLMLENWAQFKLFLPRSLELENVQIIYAESGERCVSVLERPLCGSPRWTNSTHCRWFYGVECLAYRLYSSQVWLNGVWNRMTKHNTVRVILLYCCKVAKGVNYLNVTLLRYPGFSHGDRKGYLPHDSGCIPGFRERKQHRPLLRNFLSQTRKNAPWWPTHLLSEENRRVMFIDCAIS